ncbi:hypothetical protein [Sphingobacterium sp. UBA6320]|jgi:hypothetical protein|uniref:hypothetical protein n=1 Tax=Sphingobacterium sp. UBA6320 TaxID=1947510 RepID=UPI0025D69E58|nr:hypothetical protein [Sphingobacterium sp. UBA6320]
MKKIIKKISGAVQVILLAPVKLPGKLMNIIKYIGLGLGILESVIVDKDEQEQKGEVPDDGTKPDKLLSDSDVFGSIATRATGVEKVPDRIVKYDLETGKEVLDEAE